MYKIPFLESVGENGALEPVLGSPFPTGSDPFGVAVDPFGRLVYVANNISSDVWAYQIGENGALTPVAGSPFSAGLNPYGVAVDFFAGSSTRQTMPATTSRPITSLKRGH